MLTDWNLARPWQPCSGLEPSHKPTAAEALASRTCKHGGQHRAKRVVAYGPRWSELTIESAPQLSWKSSASQACAVVR
jgi:hypothetical protein